VKTYVLDAMIALGLIAAVPRLVAMRWRWYACLLATAAAIVTVSLSVFALVATLTALAVVAIAGRTDRWLRFATTAMVALVSGVFLIAVQRTYNGHALYLYWTVTADAYVHVSANPLRFAGNVLTHVMRTGAAFPGGPTWFAGSAALVAIAGIIVAAATKHRSSQQLRARYVALLVLVALIGSIAKKFVFGPTLPGVRVALWMLPILALGLAITLQFARAGLHARPAQHAFDGFVYVLAAAVLLSTLLATPQRYRHPGPQSATRSIESQLGPHDAVFIVAGAVYSYADETRLRVRLKATPADLNSFTPIIEDPRVHDLAFAPGTARVVTPADQALIRATLAPGTAHIFVYDDDPRPLRALYSALTQRSVAEGFTKRATRFGSVRVLIYSNSASLRENSLRSPSRVPRSAPRGGS
jgi:hypothetical protein